MKLYLAGPMTGYPDYNWDSFRKYAENLRARGYEVISPAEITDQNGGKEKYLSDVETRETVTDLEYAAIAECDGIFLMEGWNTSEGSLHELKYALGLNKRVILLCDIP